MNSATCDRPVCEICGKCADTWEGSRSFCWDCLMHPTNAGVDAATFTAGEDWTDAHRAETVRTPVPPDDEIVRAERAVLAVVERAGIPVSPLAMIATLEAEGHRNGIIRAAIWYLIDRGQVELTPQRKLVPIASPGNPDWEPGGGFPFLPAGSLATADTDTPATVEDLAALYDAIFLPIDREDVDLGIDLDDYPVNDQGTPD